MLGHHLIKSWSSTQQVIALSSGEAELYSLTKGAAQTLGLIAMAKGLGVTMDGTLHTDASAALGIIAREGLGKLRHVKVQYLWIQDRIRGGDLTAQKVAGVDNPADLLTKYLAAQDIIRHAENIGHTLHDTRAEMMPALVKCSTVTFDEDEKDTWVREDGRAVRRHGQPRWCLFTPLRVEGAPTVRSLTSTRITEGEYCDTGETFKRVDNWTTRSTAHARMTRRWTGMTTFFERRR